MRSIQRRFNQFQSRHPELGSFINLAKAVKSQKFSRRMISEWFGKLVEKDDYDQKDRKRLIDHLEDLSNHP